MVLVFGCSSTSTSLDGPVPDGPATQPDSSTWEASSGRRDLGADMARDLLVPDAVQPDTKRPFDLSCTAGAEIEAEDSGQVHTTSWGVVTGGVLHNGQGLETGTAGATLSFSFVGTDLTVYHETGPNRGIFTVSVDSGVPASVNTTTSSFTFQVAAVVASGLSPGTHTAVITCQSPYCSVDYFVPHTCN